MVARVHEITIAHHDKLYKRRSVHNIYIYIGRLRFLARNIGISSGLHEASQHCLGSLFLRSDSAQ